MKVKIFTYGCQMNDLDSQKIYSMLGKDGWQQTDDTDAADLIILNTCTVREKASHKAISNLGRLKKNKSANQKLIIAVVGCVAQQEGEELRNRMPHIDIVVGTHQLHRLPELIQTARQHDPTAAMTDFNNDVPAMEIVPDQAYADCKHRAYLNIMQGCNNFCTYCIVPYVRGRELSRDHNSILGEVRTHVENGVKEIFLLGQNVNSYDGGINFSQLLAEINSIDGLERLRFTTSHPKDMSSELIANFSDLDKLCPYIHLPFQSGSDKILKAMGRQYTARHYLSLIDELRKAVPDMAFSADVIVGFPGETEDDFKDTMRLIETVGYDNLFSFKYSVRPGTKAAEMTDDVSEEDKTRRLAELQDYQKIVTKKNNQARVGRAFDVLVDGSSNHFREQINGRTPHNVIVNFEGSADLIGSTVKVKIDRANQNSLTGKILI